MDVKKYYNVLSVVVEGRLYDGTKGCLDISKGAYNYEGSFSCSTHPIGFDSLIELRKHVKNQYKEKCGDFANVDKLIIYYEIIRALFFEEEYFVSIKNEVKNTTITIKLKKDIL